MKIFRFLISKQLWFSVLLATLVLLSILLIAFAWLNSHTRHGESMAVPEIRGLELTKAAAILQQKNLRYQVTDSVFFPDKPRHIVIEQNPVPEDKVKEGRTVYLTINSAEPPTVKMPNLVDVSHRQAESILLSSGLKLGQITYKPDLAQNVVLEQQWKGRPVVPETLIPKGSSIDLVLGDGLGSTLIDIPRLLDLTYAEALFVLQGSGLTVGNVVYDEGADKNTAKVYRQNPAAADGARINQGQSVDLYLK